MECLYLNFEKKLLNEWKAPLLNDFFAMIWFGLLEKRCQQYKISDNPNIHNDLLCGSSDIISTQPIHRSIELATMITENEHLKMLFLNKNELETIQTETGTEFIDLSEFDKLILMFHFFSVEAVDTGEKIVEAIQFVHKSFREFLVMELIYDWIVNSLHSREIPIERWLVFGKVSIKAAPRRRLTRKRRFLVRLNDQAE